MAKVNFGRQPHEWLKPFEIFEMIGGTSTGGYDSLPSNILIGIMRRVSLQADCDSARPTQDGRPRVY
jgi:hypothetical protein